MTAPLDPFTVAQLRATVRHIPRHTIGGLIPYPFALLPSPTPGQWLIYREGRPACEATLADAATLASLEWEALDAILDPTISPDEALSDAATREARTRGRQAAAALAQARLAEQERERQRLDFQRRERAAIARIDVTKLDLEDF